MLSLCIKAIASPGFRRFAFCTLLFAVLTCAIAWLPLWYFSISRFPLLLIFTVSLIVFAPLRAGYQIHVWISKVKSDAGKDEFPIPEADDERLELARKYYNYFRDEIKREDEITHQRVTWTTTFQGFIISAMTLLLILDWDGTRKIVPLGRLSLFAIGIMGVSIGLVSFMGILASRRSTTDAIAAWSRRDAQWGLYSKSVPQAHGQQNAFAGGHTFAVLMPALFILMWTLFLAGYALLSYFTWIEPCLDRSDILRCMFIRPPTRFSLFGYEITLPWNI